ncbi:site-specific integrase [Streptomyces sp. DSM 44917]|uniref:Site-specific integrase n=1 Tax=Streptomyces boetiae TaxID=3075541 RepID=A0ABU2L8Y7_9ACTN|nr:site-specific integrase [Streptomyces sp. DSM 44917]MDT0308045.1 site-specific integrase [Streptomyces sp. DSM 44917]
MWIEDRWHKKRPGAEERECGKHRSKARRMVATKKHGMGSRWSVGYYDPSGNQREEVVPTEERAKERRTELETELSRGAWVDPEERRMTLEEHAGRWLEGRSSGDAATVDGVARHLRLHILPVLGSRALKELEQRPSLVQAWLSGLTAGDRYARNILRTLRAVLQAAVEDGIILRNPCAMSTVRPPKPVAKKIIPWEDERIRAVLAALPARYRRLGVAGAYCGLRQGELFGLSPDDVDRARGVVHLRYQVQLLPSGVKVFKALKGRSAREVPLPDVVAAELAEHEREWPVTFVTLPLVRPDGAEMKRALYFVDEDASALNRTNFNRNVWKPTLARAGIIPDRPRGAQKHQAAREDGCHALRHYYARFMLEKRVPIESVSEFMGHSDPGFTLRTYGHLRPDAVASAREMVNRALPAL